MATKTSTHPHFDDRGTLDWQTDFDAALERARKERKLVFIEYGREQCSQCRALVQNTIPRDEIAALLREHFVPLAIDCDEGPEEVDELAAKLEDATMLPFVMIVDPQGQFLEGNHGVIEAGTLQRMLERYVDED